MSDVSKEAVRVFSRKVARPLTEEDIDQISGGACLTGCYRNGPGHTHNVTNCDGSEAYTDTEC